MPTNIETIISASTQGFVNALNQASAAVDKNVADWAEEFYNVNESAEIVKMSIDNLTEAAINVGKDFKIDNSDYVRATNTIEEKQKAIQKAINKAQEARQDANSPVTDKQIQTLVKYQMQIDKAASKIKQLNDGKSQFGFLNEPLKFNGKEIYAAS